MTDKKYLTPEQEAIKAKKDEIRALREQGEQQRKKAKFEREQVRAERDTRLLTEDAILGRVQAEIHAYNRAGKEARIKLNILERLESLLDEPVVVNQTLEVEE